MSDLNLRYHQFHEVSHPRSKWALLTGLPANSDTEDLVLKYVEVLRKSIGKGQHIPLVLVWNPDPVGNDFPERVQAELMDQMIKRDHNTVPIEVVSLQENGDDLFAVYKVTVTEEQLENEEKGLIVPGEPEPFKKAKMSPGEFALGAIIFGGMGYILMPKRPESNRWVAALILGTLGGSVTAVIAKRKAEGTL